MLEKIINYADIDTEKTQTYHEDFDHNKFEEPVNNSRKNKVLETVQAIFFACICVMLASILFVDYGKWEVGLVAVLVMFGIFVLEQFKDKEAQAKYDEYADWAAERDELEE